MHRGGPRGPRRDHDLPVCPFPSPLTLRTDCTWIRTDRVGHHSTSDDSFAYRPRKEVEDRKRLDNPILRFRLYLEAKGWWSKDEEVALVKGFKEEVSAAYKRAERLPKPPVEEMFNEVYGGEMPWNLVRCVVVSSFRPSPPGGRGRGEC